MVWPTRAGRAGWPTGPARGPAPRLAPENEVILDKAQVIG